MKQFKYDDDHVLNMDETPTWFDCAIKRTIDSIGAKDVAIKVVADGRKRVTTVLTISKSGKMFPPCIITSS